MIVEMPPTVMEGKKIVVLQSSSKLVFDGDYWMASDIGDYTNWTTGEAASGRLFQPEGPILWAFPFRDYVLVGKKHAAYRGRYVGGIYKWRWDWCAGELPADWWPQESRWECQYCKSTHPDGVENCTSCGAHRQ